MSLDVLRLLAVFLVLGRHLPEPPARQHGFLSQVFGVWNTGGWIGVDLFFVLSGFLVSGLLFSEFKTRGRLSIGRFYVRRGWKIYPPFFLMIAATVVIRNLKGIAIQPAEVAAEVFFVQSYLPGMWTHTWSLAVEEHFYLLLPLVLTLLVRWNRGSSDPFRPILKVAAAVMVFALVARFGNAWIRSTYSELTHVFPTHLRFDALFAGVALSYLFHFATDDTVARCRPLRKSLILGGALLMWSAFRFDLETTPLIYTIGFTVFSVGSGMMLMGMLMLDLSQHSAWRWLAALGKYSYSIYLWHVLVLAWLLPLVGEAVGVRLPFAITVLLQVALSLVVGVIMAKLVEVPALWLRDRFFPDLGRGALVPVADVEVTTSGSASKGSVLAGETG